LGSAMFSELIIAATLLANAGAILNFKLAKQESFDFTDAPPTIGEKMRLFLSNLRYFRLVIAVWNVFIVFCMLIVFS